MNDQSDQLNPPARQLSDDQHRVLRSIDAGEVLTPETLAHFAQDRGYDAGRSGRLVFDLDEARKEYGDEVRKAYNSSLKATGSQQIEDG